MTVTVPGGFLLPRLLPNRLDDQPEVRHGDCLWIAGMRVTEKRPGGAFGAVAYQSRRAFCVFGRGQAPDTGSWSGLARGAPASPVRLTALAERKPKLPVQCWTPRRGPPGNPRCCCGCRARSCCGWHSGSSWLDCSTNRRAGRGLTTTLPEGNTPSITLNARKPRCSQDHFCMLICSLNQKCTLM